jgi:hypothetical protein
VLIKALSHTHAATTYSGRVRRTAPRFARILAPLALAAIAATGAGCGGGGGSAVEPGAQAATTPPAAHAVSWELADEARSARGLARLYERTAAQVWRVRVTRAQAGSKDRALTALHRATRAYRLLGAAAASGNAEVYASRLGSAEQSRESVRQALSAFRASGVGALPPTPAGARTATPVTQPPSAGDSVSDDPSDDAADEPDENDNEPDEADSGDDSDGQNDPGDDSDPSGDDG